MFVKTFWTFWCTLSVTRSYNGPHFIADLIREFLLLIGVKHCLTHAYSKEEKTIVERCNKEINRHLRALTYDNSSLTDYKKSLQFVQRILNSYHNDRLKFSAPQMLFGNMLNLDKGIFLPLEERPVSIRPLSLCTSESSLCKRIYLKNLLQNHYALIYYMLYAN